MNKRRATSNLVTPANPVSSDQDVVILDDADDTDDEPVRPPVVKRAKGESKRSAPRAGSKSSSGGSSTTIAGGRPGSVSRVHKDGPAGAIATGTVKGGTAKPVVSHAFRVIVATDLIKRLVDDKNRESLRSMCDLLSATGVTSTLVDLMAKATRLFQAPPSLLSRTAWCHLTRHAEDPAQATAALVSWITTTTQLSRSAWTNPDGSMALYTNVTGALAADSKRYYGAESDIGDDGQSGDARARRLAIRTPLAARADVKAAACTFAAEEFKDDDVHSDDARALAPIKGLDAVWTDARGAATLRAVCIRVCKGVVGQLKPCFDKSDLRGIRTALANVAKRPLPSESKEAHATRAEAAAFVLSLVHHACFAVGGPQKQCWDDVVDLCALARQWAATRRECQRLRMDGEIVECTVPLLNGSYAAYMGRLTLATRCGVRYTVTSDPDALVVPAWIHMLQNRPLLDAVFRRSPNQMGPWPPTLTMDIAPLIGDAASGRLLRLRTAFALTATPTALGGGGEATQTDRGGEAIQTVDGSDAPSILVAGGVADSDVAVGLRGLTAMESMVAYYNRPGSLYKSTNGGGAAGLLASARAWMAMLERYAAPAPFTYRMYMGASRDLLDEDTATDSSSTSASGSKQRGGNKEVKEGGGVEEEKEEEEEEEEEGEEGPEAQFPSAFPVIAASGDSVDRRLASQFGPQARGFAFLRAAENAREPLEWNDDDAHVLAAAAFAEARMWLTLPQISAALEALVAIPQAVARFIFNPHHEVLPENRRGPRGEQWIRHDRVSGANYLQPIRLHRRRPRLHQRRVKLQPAAYARELAHRRCRPRLAGGAGAGDPCVPQHPVRHQQSRALSVHLPREILASLILFLYHSSTLSLWLVVCR